ncbi:uncharacterized protein VTP21DRAFT_11708 [Calcarisporiella thermophila]|uniref:uncharacterized protein n=1 Tax=Calcarisporiella thermophila TaxID=911321 RepID=UPI0037421187
MNDRRLYVLSLYKRLLQIGKKMPSATRQTLVTTRVRQEFKDNKRASDVDFLIKIAETQLDNLEAQQQHLTNLAKRTDLLIPVDLNTTSMKKSSRSRVGKFNRFMQGPEPSWIRKKREEQNR